MSNQTKQGKVIGRFTISFDDETKAQLAALQEKMAAINSCFGIGNIKPTGGLLAAMASDAANDAPVMYSPWENDLKRAAEFDLATADDDSDTAIPAAIALSSTTELKQLGQWIFEGQDEKWVHVITDKYGKAFKFLEVPPSSCFGGAYQGYHHKFISGGFQPYQSVTRQPVNDVDYLSDTMPEINAMEASDIIIDEMGRDYSHNSNCLHAVVPQITQADMQLIFIKNLSNVLIQRMHSMDRFSEDDHRVVCSEFKAWDIVVNKANDNPHYAVVCGFGVINSDEVAQKISLIKVTPWDSRDGHCQGGDWMIFGQKSNWRTITEAELTAFRAVLEACYA